MLFRKKKRPLRKFFVVMEKGDAPIQVLATETDFYPDESLILRVDGKGVAYFSKVYSFYVEELS